MNFLKDDFLEQISADIDKDGNVLIERMPFSPSRILLDDEEAFDAAFTAWCDDKKQERLSKADEILELHDNADRFKTLKQSYARGSVTPFVGAGLSIPSGYPGWTSYLYQLRRETTVSEAKLDSFIGKGEYEEAAQALYDAMPPDAFDEHLENKFDTKDEPLSGCVRYLPHCFTSSVITTNFDGVLKRCYDDFRKPFDEELLGADAIELPRLLGRNKNVLVKLHGKANTARSRVLTKAEYDAHYGAATKLGDCIQAIAGKTLLFLGCSLSSDRTVKCLQKIREESGSAAAVRHYAFIPIGDDNDERLRRRDELVKANIFPIWYPEDENHDECLMALLSKLVEGAK